MEDIAGMLTVRGNSFAVYGSIRWKIREFRGIIASYLADSSTFGIFKFFFVARYMMIGAATYTGIRDMEQHPSAGLLTVRVNSFAVYGSILTMIVVLLLL